MNILVSKHFKLKDSSTGWFKKTTQEELSFYDEMKDIMMKSARKNLKGIDDIIIFEGEVDNIQEAFGKNFFQLYDLWKQGHNVLYCDLDVLWWRPINVFEKYTKFSMFNYANITKSLKHKDLYISDYLNCGIRYQPATMKESSWELGKELWQEKDKYCSLWDYEQYIYNRMLYNENSLEEVKNMINPKLNYAMITFGLDNYINLEANQGIPILHSYAIHYHASKEPEIRLNEIKKIWIDDE